ncbi:MAG: hypothetical protein ABI723_02355 [Bacteroidia bacterium]
MKELIANIPDEHVELIKQVVEKLGGEFTIIKQSANSKGKPKKLTAKRKLKA